MGSRREPDEQGPITVAVRTQAVPPGWTSDVRDTPGVLDAALTAAGLDALLAEVLRRGPGAGVEPGGESPPASSADADRVAAQGERADRVERPRASVLVGVGAVTFTAPEVVRGLVGRLEEAGMDVRLLAAVPARDRDLGWIPETVAIRCGLDSAGLRDPLADLAPSGLPETSVHHGRLIARDWLDADLRVLVAPCATDAGQGFVGVLSALAGIAPRVPGAEPAEALADLAHHAPPDLAVLDATVVSHGAFGTSVRRELWAGTVVASRSAMLVDLAAASLLGLDPAISPTVAACIARIGLPNRHSVDGVLRAAPGVEVPTVPLVRSLPETGGTAGMARVLAAALAVDGRNPAGGMPAEGWSASRASGAVVLGGLGHGGDRGAASGQGGDRAAGSDDDGDRGAGSGDDPILAALRSALAPWVTASTHSPMAASALTALHGAAAVAAEAVTAWRTNFAKHSLARVEAPLGLDLSAYRAADYEAVEEVLRPLVEQVDAMPDTPDPLKWRHVDGSVIFAISRTVNADYGSWVERVDVSQAIRLMADYLGGRRVVVARDRSGRPIRQAERNVYLPQPNYVAFSGGRVIDVCKLEVIRYGRNARTIWWQTVRSPNGSADYDDGTVEFADVGEGRTRVTIRGRQRFTLPLFWQVVDIDRFPGLRDVLTVDAYRRFFTATLDNFEACYEGRPFEIGRPPVDRGLATRDASALVALAREGAKEWLSRTLDEGVDQATGYPDSGGATGAFGLAREVARQWIDVVAGPGSSAAATAAGGPRASRTPRPDEIDADGFRHFRGVAGG